MLTAPATNTSVQATTVHLVSCRHDAPSHDDQCIAEDVEHGLRITLSRVNGLIHGHIAGCDNRRYWHRATVRLFGSQGFIASSPVDTAGRFFLPDVAPGQRYSLGVVLAYEKGVLLKIIGDFSIQ